MSNKTTSIDKDNIQDLNKVIKTVLKMLIALIDKKLDDCEPIYDSNKLKESINIKELNAKTEELINLIVTKGILIDKFYNDLKEKIDSQNEEEITLQIFEETLKEYLKKEKDVKLKEKEKEKEEKKRALAEEKRKRREKRALAEEKKKTKKIIEKTTSLEFLYDSLKKGPIYNFEIGFYNLIHSLLSDSDFLGYLDLKDDYDLTSPKVRDFLERHVYTQKSSYNIHKLLSVLNYKQTILFLNYINFMEAQQDKKQYVYISFRNIIIAQLSDSIQKEYQIDDQVIKACDKRRNELKNEGRL